MFVETISLPILVLRCGALVLAVFIDTGLGRFEPTRITRKCLFADDAIFLKHKNDLAAMISQTMVAFVDSTLVLWQCRLCLLVLYRDFVGHQIVGIRFFRSQRQDISACLDHI